MPPKPSFFRSDDAPKKSSKLPTHDQSFDDRAVHLQNNIYASDKGKLRLLILQRDLDWMTNVSSQLSVLDAGCGAGWMSEWALSHGHHVTACDSAEVMVESVRQRLGEHSQLSYQTSSIQSLALSYPVDVVFCHAVLEWINDQDAVLDKLVDAVKPNGTLSLMFYNSWAREMAQLVYGNFDYIDKDYEVRQRVKLSPHWPCCPDAIEDKLMQRGMRVTVRSGIRVFYDIIRHKNHYERFAEDIVRHELRVSQMHPYWQMGRYVHFLAKKMDFR